MGSNEHVLSFMTEFTYPLFDSLSESSRPYVSLYQSMYELFAIEHVLRTKDGQVDAINWK